MSDDNIKSLENQGVPGCRGSQIGINYHLCRWCGRCACQDVFGCPDPPSECAGLMKVQFGDGCHV